MAATWTVYCHTHAETGRHYVGITSGTMESRWAKHVRRSMKFAGRSYFQRELARLGPGSFSHRVLASGLTQRQAMEEEAAQILRLRAAERDRGFNTRPEKVRSRKPSFRDLF